MGVREAVRCGATVAGLVGVDPPCSQRVGYFVEPSRTKLRPILDSRIAPQPLRPLTRLDVDNLYKEIVECQNTWAPMSTQSRNRGHPAASNWCWPKQRSELSAITSPVTNCARWPRLWCSTLVRRSRRS